MCYGRWVVNKIKSWIEYSAENPTVSSTLILVQNCDALNTIIFLVSFPHFHTIVEEEEYKRILSFAFQLTLSQLWGIGKFLNSLYLYVLFCFVLYICKDTQFWWFEVQEVDFREEIEVLRSGLWSKSLLWIGRTCIFWEFSRWREEHECFYGEIMLFQGFVLKG